MKKESLFFLLFFVLLFVLGWTSPSIRLNLASKKKPQEVLMQNTLPSLDANEGEINLKKRGLGSETENQSQTIDEAEGSENTFPVENNELVIEPI